ncbi:MAG: type VI secretion system tip protein VgrG [Acidobacteriota bacterium]
MSAPSPLLLAGSLTTFTIKASGARISSTYQVVLVETWISVNRLPKAKLVLYDGSAAAGAAGEGEFPISSAPTFLPGQEIEISAGYNGQESTLFSGVVVKQGIELGDSGSPKLHIELTDKATRMTLARKNAVFAKVTDSQLIEKLITANGLSASVTATQTLYEDIVQYYASDWDLLIMRAELNGFVVVADAGSVTVAPPNTQDDPVLTVAFGSSMLDFEGEMDAATQYTSAAIESSAWDESTQQVINNGPGSITVTTPGNVTSDQLARTFNIAQYAQQTGAMLSKDSLKDWSTSELLKSRLSKIRGRVRFQGSALAKAGRMIQLEGLGDRFNGAAYVSGVRHVITQGNWLTTATIGLAWPWFSSEAPEVAAPGASGQLPPVQGLQTGKVQQISDDPAGEFRVLVTLPILGSTGASGIWARLGTFYGSNRFGAVFFPEIGDEVIVAFMNDDPRFPVIVGSVYSKPLPPPYPPDSENTIKGIKTRSSIELTFDDKNKIFVVTTPGGRSVTLDDSAGKITITDKKKTISMSGDLITIQSDANIEMSATGNITLSAGGNLTLKATGDAAVSGLNVSHKASVGFSAQGGASAKLAASGSVSIQGALVGINS